MCAPSLERGRIKFFDGKVGIWFFAIDRKAKRSSKNTGTVSGVTDILDPVTVDAAEYRSKMCGKNGVFAKIREKMPWLKGKTIYLQHDGAKPHTAKMNLTRLEDRGQEARLRDRRRRPAGPITRPQLLRPRLLQQSAIRHQVRRSVHLVRASRGRFAVLGGLSTRKNGVLLALLDYLLPRHLGIGVAATTTTTATAKIAGGPVKASQKTVMYRMICRHFFTTVPSVYPHQRPSSRLRQRCLMRCRKSRLG